ncbi:MAG: hypothetical protein OER88_01235 [Planctomycetota bacterium]|nr:hypothetical protein [Planctomycetota bacterium]
MVGVDGIRAPWRLLLLTAALCCAGGCSIVLSRIGDADLSVVHAGALRGDVEDEIGSPDEAEDERGLTRAVYVLKLGKRADTQRAVARTSESTSHAIAIGTATGRAVRDAASAGFGTFGEVVGTATGVAVGGVIIIGAEAIGTVRQIARLIRRERHRLIVWYDASGRVRRHRLERVRRSAKTTASPAYRSDDDDARRRWEDVLTRQAR